MAGRLDTLVFLRVLFRRRVVEEEVLGRFLLASGKSSRCSSSRVSFGGLCRASWDRRKESSEGMPEKERWKKVDRD